MTRTLLTTGYTGADKEDSLGLELLAAADRVGVVRVTTVNDNVTLLEVGEELLNESVDGGTGLDEENYLARALKLGNEFLDRLGANDVGACGMEKISRSSRAKSRTGKIGGDW